MFALIQNGQVWELFATDPKMPSTFDVRNVSGVTGIAQGWVMGQSGAFMAPTPPAVPLATAQAAQLATLRAACAATITDQFQSSALGDPYRYGSKMEDQANYDTAMMAASQANGPTATGWFRCLDASLPSTPTTLDAPGTVWPMVSHGQAQIAQVWEDCQAMIAAARTKLAGLEAQVVAATTVAAVQAVAWA